MKRLNYFLFCIVALGMIFFQSCSNETLLVNDDVPPGGKGQGQVSFILPMSVKKSTTYAPVSTIAAEVAENEIHTLKIYWFKESTDAQGNQDTLLYKVFTYPSSSNQIEEPMVGLTESTSVTDKSQYVATISTGTETAVSRFYIVANVNSESGTGVQSKPLKNLVLGVTKEKTFKTILTDTLVVQGGNLALLTCPIPMSVDKSTNNNDMAVEINLASETTKQVRLMRRVARFDILNSADFSNFEIKNVIISDARTAGFLQDTTGGTFKTGKTIIDVSATANGHRFTGDSLADKGNISGGIKDNKIPDAYDAGADTAEWHKSQFYLYPTVLGKNNTGTVITLEGLFMKHETRVYTLQLANDFPIEANMAYKIMVKRNTENSADFEFTIEPWGWNNDSIMADRNSTLVTFSHIALSKTDTSKVDVIEVGDGTNPADIDTIRYTTAPGQLYTEILLTNRGYTLNDDYPNGSVTTVSLSPSYSGFTASDSLTVESASPLSTFTTTRTYGGLQYETTHHIMLPATDAPIAYELIVTSATVSTRKKHYYIESWNYGKTGYAPIKINDILWAPVNVGATTLKVGQTWTDGNDGYQYTGDHFQWGRNIGFAPNATIKTTTTQVTDMDHIYTDSSFITKAHWFTPTEPSGLWGDTIPYDHVRAQGPCPEGWRVPTSAEWNAMKSVLTSRTGANWWYTFTNASKTITLYFPYTGMRLENGTLSAYTQVSSLSGYYWTSTIASGLAYRAYFYGTNTMGDVATAGSDVQGRGFAIRAVRDYVPMPWERPKPPTNP
jgi:uncharacterized protein (TIGR02145 family)